METKIENILSKFVVSIPSSITQIYRSAWDIDDTYVLKTNDDKSQLDKSIMLNQLLLSEGVPVIEFIYSTNGKPYVYLDGKYWCLMKKIKGYCFDPFVGELKNNGIMLGKAIAKLHIALKSIENKVEAYESDFSDELLSWIVPELEKHSVSFSDGVMDSIVTFLGRDYKALPRQLIHRDIHTSNLLYENGTFSFIDFDLSQRNVRIFDIVYLGCSQLVENYKDETRLKHWCEIFRGILHGYNELLPLSEEEINAIPFLFVFDEMLFTAFYLKTGQPEIAKSCEEMTNWLHKNIATIIR
ncbi:MAG: phosphotransferase [Eubacteriales bacterium]|nr:phosphotransferase [Eubacteriales bacterium]